MVFGLLTVRPNTFIDVYIYEKRNLKVTKMYVLWSGWWWGECEYCG